MKSSSAASGSIHTSLPHGIPPVPPMNSLSSPIRSQFRRLFGSSLDISSLPPLFSSLPFPSFSSIQFPVALAESSGFSSSSPSSPSSSASLPPSSHLPQLPHLEGMVDGSSALKTMLELESSGAKLVAVQVVFRHGARTPLSKMAHLWKGVSWDCCDEVYKGVPMVVLGKEALVAGTPAHASLDWDAFRKGNTKIDPHKKMTQPTSNTRRDQDSQNSNAAAAAAATSCGGGGFEEPEDIVQVNDLIVDVDHHEAIRKEQWRKRMERAAARVGGEEGGELKESRELGERGELGEAMPKKSHLLARHERNVLADSDPCISDSVRHVSLHPVPYTEDRRRALHGGCAAGQLTRVGQQQALALGQWLRIAYGSRLRLLEEEKVVGSDEKENLERRKRVWLRTTNYT
eukprot:CAMPEP_0175064750 /NCGR_PEP_ID=MMETSP0052_2-20121109/15518_1 /TAXON_ID=51329 ORGANISM="Polytomella parva, Strain SAG 63-3" /NCGR_SAMPLE_ID=MMETSP0052_2 /ASSEMBLY_ACC=CAM_ASM_000194 /LENGTH=401 /DNA_ID=CAMNT_0016331159 /DNA_START=255 /DNA_END=1456 /DNA_ORIENTATION=-